MNQLTINNSLIELFVGDLAKAEYDAIVIPTNSRLLPSGDVRCKILKEAGHTVQVECNKIINEGTSIPIGNAVITSGGDLNTKHIIHTRSGHDQRKLMLSIWNSLLLADKNELTSIVFPAISKEVLGFNSKISADIMIKTIKKYLMEKNSNIKNVSICLESLPDYKDFENSLDKSS